RKLSAIFQETREMIVDWAHNAGIDFNAFADEDEARHKRRRQLVDNHPLTKAGKKYANTATDWFREFDQMVEISDLEDAREVIQWYQYQIAVKTMRALSGRKEELD